MRENTLRREMKVLDSNTRYTAESIRQEMKRQDRREMFLGKQTSASHKSDMTTKISLSHKSDMSNQVSRSHKSSEQKNLSGNRQRCPKNRVSAARQNDVKKQSGLFHSVFGKLVIAAILVAVLSIGAFGPFASFRNPKTTYVDASTNKTVTRVVKYKAVEIEAGDSLWSIASEYKTPEWGNTYSYMKAIVDCNDYSGQLQEGASLLVPYYDYE